MALSPPSSRMPGLVELTPALAADVPIQGALAETLPRWALSASTITLTTGVMRVTAIRLLAGQTYTSISFLSGSTALGVGVHQIFGLYDDQLGSSTGTARALLRGTSDDTNTAWAGTTVKTLQLTASYTAVRTGVHYVAVLIEAGTMPTLTGASGGASAASQIAPVVGGTTGVGLTALPDPAAAFTAQTTAVFAWLL